MKNAGRKNQQMNIATHFVPKSIQNLIKIVMFGISFNRKTSFSLYLNSIMALADANVMYLIIQFA